MDTKETLLRTRHRDRFKAIVINDPHFAAKSPPAFKTDNYLETLTSNVKQVFNLARREEVDVVIWTGDFFHLKEPANNPLWLIARVIRILAESNLRHAGIGGNHDLRYGGLEAGLYGSPLEIVLESGRVTLLDEKELVFTTEDGLSVRVAGGSYEHGRAEHVRDKKKRGADRLIVAGHFWLGTQTGEFYGEHLFGHDYFAQAEADVVAVGHHHEDKGVHLVDGRHFVAPGSISITGTHGHDLQRRPAASLIEMTRKETKIHVVRPKTPPASELLDLERYRQLKEEQEETDQFIASLAQSELLNCDPDAILEGMNILPDVKERSRRYIEAAEAKR
jgi:DNA repair exonuclease SbcCD nuclease subunit